MQIRRTLEPHAFGTEIQHVRAAGCAPARSAGSSCAAPTARAVAAGTFRYRYGDDSDAVLSSALDLSRTEAIGVRAGDRTFLAPIENAPTTERFKKGEYEKENDMRQVSRPMGLAGGARRRLRR